MATKKTNKTNKGNNVMTNVGIGAAVAAAAAGAYFLYGTDKGKKQRHKMEKWTVDARKEVVKQIEKLKDVNEDAYHSVVDNVALRYKKLKDINPAEIAALAIELKGHWNNIQREFKKSKNTVSKISKVSGKKVGQIKRAVKSPKTKKTPKSK